MSVKIIGSVDASLEQVQEVFSEYAAQHPQAEISIYRQNSVSIRVRIIDPQFRGVSKGARHDQIWQLVEKLPEEVQQDISVLLLLTPEETKNSLMNLEFEQPSPSRL